MPGLRARRRTAAAVVSGRSTWGGRHGCVGSARPAPPQIPPSHGMPCASGPSRFRAPRGAWATLGAEKGSPGPARGDSPVTEAEWSACAAPDALLDHLGGRCTERTLRLFACACCGPVWHLITEPACRTAIEVALRFA